MTMVATSQGTMLVNCIWDLIYPSVFPHVASFAIQCTDLKAGSQSWVQVGMKEIKWTLWGKYCQLAFAM